MKHVLLIVPTLFFFWGIAALDVRAEPEGDCWTGTPTVYTSTVTLLNMGCGVVVEWTTQVGPGDSDYGVLGELPGTKIVFPGNVTWLQVWTLDTWDAGDRPYWDQFQNDLAESRALALGIPVSEIPIDAWPTGSLMGVDFCPTVFGEAALMFGGSDSNWMSIEEYPDLCGWKVVFPEVQEVYVPIGSIFWSYEQTYSGPALLEVEEGEMWLGDEVPTLPTVYSLYLPVVRTPVDPAQCVAAPGWGQTFGPNCTRFDALDTYRVVEWSDATFSYHGVFVIAPGAHWIIPAGFVGTVWVLGSDATPVSVLIYQIAVAEARSAAFGGVPVPIDTPPSGSFRW